MLETTKKFEVIFIRLEEINPKYLSYFEVGLKEKQKNLDIFGEVSFYI